MVILVKEATGIGVSSPDWAEKPRAGTATAAWPAAGHGRGATTPGTDKDAGHTERSCGAAIGRVARTPTKAPAAARTITSAATNHHRRRSERRRRRSLRVVVSGGVGSTAVGSVPPGTSSVLLSARPTPRGS